VVYVTENRSVGGSIPPLGTILLDSIKLFLDGAQALRSVLVWGRRGAEPPSNGSRDPARKAERIAQCRAAQAELAGRKLVERAADLVKSNAPRFAVFSWDAASNALSCGDENDNSIPPALMQALGV